MTALLPRSPKARMRLLLIAVAGPILALAVGLSLWAMRAQVTFFYGPSEARAQGTVPGRLVRLGGLVAVGSVEHAPDGVARFVVTDNRSNVPVSYRGDLPDLFREGQGVVVQGRFRADGGFDASQVLAKHDETYMPREVAERLKRQGEWRGAR